MDAHTGHDHHFHRYNWPSFLELIPPAGRGTLDLGCGEGRAGIALRDLGHRVTGVDAAPALAKLATQTGAYEKVIVADAAALPFTDRSFDLVGCRLIGRKSGICLQIDRDTDFDTPQTTAVVISIGRVFNGAHYPGDVGAPLQRLLSFPRCPVRLEG